MHDSWNYFSTQIVLSIIHFSTFQPLESCPQDADGNPMWDLGNMKKVVVRDFKGKTYIDIREYYVDKNTMDTR